MEVQACSHFLQPRQQKSEAAFLSPLVPYIKTCLLKAGDSDGLPQLCHLDSEAEIQQVLPTERRLIFIQLWPWMRRTRYLNPISQALLKANCHHLIDADALERAGVSKSQSQSTRLSRFLELMTMDLFSFCRLIMKLSEGLRTLIVSCLQGHFSQLFNLSNFNLI